MKNRLFLTIFYSFIILFITTFTNLPIQAQTIYVPTNYPTIQAAVSAAAWGDTIIVEDGIYKGVGNKEIAFIGKILTLKSLNGSSNTIIDCEFSGRAFQFTTNEGRGSIIDGFTIKNGYAPEGGGIYLYNASPIIRDCVIQNCESFQGEGGGGIYGEGSSALVEDCVIENNISCAQGGGCFFLAGFPEVIDSKILNNRTSTITQSGCSFWKRGGGIYYRYNIVDDKTGTTKFTNNIFSGNQSLTGGGLYVGGGKTVIIDSSTFTGNSAGNGGAMSVIGSEIYNLNIKNCTFEQNSAKFGGAIESDNSVYFLNCTVINNSAGEGGGYYSGGAGTAPIFENCVFSGNSVGNLTYTGGEYYTAAGGGGLCFPNVAHPIIRGCTIKNNSANSGKGGGIYLHYNAFNDESKRAEIINTVITGNVSAGEGGGIYFDQFCYEEPFPAKLINNTITENSGSQSGGIYIAYGDPIIQNSIVYFNTPTDILDTTGLASITYCNTTNLIDGTGNVSVFPDFVGSGDFRLSVNSACINAGSGLMAPVKDRDKNVRPYGNNVDIGAYECVSYSNPIADFSISGNCGIAPFGVTFEDKSTGGVFEWLWDFNDGQTSAGSNPQHVFSTPGNYTIRLSVSGPGGSDSVEKVNMIAVAINGSDVSGDGIISLLDAIVVLRIMTNSYTDNLPAIADINNNQKIGLPEAIYILNFLAGSYQ